MFPEDKSKQETAYFLWIKFALFAFDSISMVKQLYSAKCQIHINLSDFRLTDLYSGLLCIQYWIQIKEDAAVFFSKETHSTGQGEKLQKVLHYH